MIESIRRARHRHIEQPAVLVLGLADACARARLQRPAGSSALRPAQTTHARRMPRVAPAGRRMSRRRAVSGRRRRGVGQKHDRRLQPLGAVHRHHPDFVARDFHVALHLGVGGAQPGHEALQRCRCLALRRRSASSRNSSSASLASCPSRPRMRARPPSPPSTPGIERERRLAAAPRASQAIEARRAASKACVCRALARPALRAASPCAARPSLNRSSSSSPNSGLFSATASARSSSRQQQRVRQVHQVDDRDVLGQLQPVGAGDRDVGVLRAPG